MLAFENQLLQIQVAVIKVYERRFRRTCADVDRQNWVKKTTEMRAVYEHKNNEYWRTEIAASNGNMKRLWQRLHGLLGEEPSGELCYAILEFNVPLNTV